MAKRGRQSTSSSSISKPSERVPSRNTTVMESADRQQQSAPVSASIPAPGSRRFRLTAWHAAPAILVIVMFVLMWPASRVDSATMDEQNHIARGLAYLRTGSLRLNRMHPPLINIISAIPLALDRSITLPLKGPSWAASNLDGFALELLWQTNDGPAMVKTARIPIMALAALLALTVFAWASEMFGRPAGLLAMTLVVFCPNVLAHGHLATNDAGAACFATLALYLFWRFLRTPNWKRGATCAIALTLALGSKFSALFLLPVFAMIFVTYAVIGPGEQSQIKWLKQVAIMAVVGCAIIVVLIWALYGFKTGITSEGGAKVPASSYLEGLEEVRQRLSKGNPTFLLGQYSGTGWWYFFPFVFAVKTPLPTLILIAAGIVQVYRARDWKNAAFLLIPVIVYFGMTIVSPIDIGYRHLLPVLPLLLILASRAAPSSFNLKAWPTLVVAGLVLWLVVESVAVAPHYLAFFNEAAGGPSNGYQVLTDSNLDWGQDLIGLRDYMNRNGVESVNLSYFGSTPPEAYGIKYVPLISYPRHMFATAQDLRILLHPPPGVYAISATNLQGVMFPDHHFYQWFKDQKPDAVIGHTIFVYVVH
ncbi:MAG TPA: glycosyltransferase family 39 protein [Blastocatellia bacterium]|nr:glycosyltransferase family 39 protein [Blastocatellia bacterium]